MRWDTEWRLLARRLDNWTRVAELFFRTDQTAFAQTTASDAAGLLTREPNEIVAAIDALELPSDIQDEFARAREGAAGLLRTTGESKHSVWCRWLGLSALRIPLDNHLRTTEEPRRRLVERAFLHLNRTLSVDQPTRDAWREAFEYEPDCEKLGALHLLGHGIYAFKAEAGTGRTDLILNDALVEDDVKNVEAMALTEWKCVRDANELAASARTAKEQIERYANVELLGFELRTHRYAVLVTEQAMRLPADELIGAVHLHYINIVINPERPSVQADRMSRRGRSA